MRRTARPLCGTARLTVAAAAMAAGATYRPERLARSGLDLREVTGRRGRGRAAPDRVGPETLADLVDCQIERRIDLRRQGQLELCLVAEVRHRDAQQGQPAALDHRHRSRED